MPVLILWAVPTLIVVGGVGYYLVPTISLDRLQDKKKARAAMPAGLFSSLPVPAGSGISLERTLLSAPSGLVHITRRD